MDWRNAKIAILDDYQDVVRTLDCFAKLQGHEVTVWNDHTKDVDVLARRLQDTEALVMIRERTPIRAPLIARLPKLKLVSHHSVYLHIGYVERGGYERIFSSIFDQILAYAAGKPVNMINPEVLAGSS